MADSSEVTDEYIRATPSRRWRLARLGIRMIIVVSVTINFVAALSLVLETRDVAATKNAYAETVQIGAEDTRGLIKTLDEPANQALLADPFFKTAEWDDFREAVASDDADHLSAMREQVTSQTEMFIWPHTRRQLDEWTATLTLSLTSDQRAQLYATRALELCGNSGDEATVYEMFDGPGDEEADAELARRVIDTAKTHCP